MDAILYVRRTGCSWRQLPVVVPPAAVLRSPTTVTLRDSYQPDRIGWHEITATSHAVAIRDPPVPTTSISDELRSHPDDLLASPLDQRTVELRTTPGTTGTDAMAPPLVPIAGPLTRAMSAAGDRLNTLVGSDQLTPLAGLLGILLALLLGAAHAALPGHGKTVMAAYIAGRQGTYRDAITVGITVTATHTIGVLVIGILRGLIGIGVAGGLVPSPSALIALLGAIALGRTWFGVLLVIAYGLGMATALTAAGLLLVHLNGRLAHRIGTASARLAAVTPWATATLVLIVGVVMAAQALGPLLGLDGYR
ncbi:hypothetical protein H4W31_006403 [Plantactinospora soyae]|uniref:Nickel/cobalt efflux system n=1 Tax=Plantactinospora soyae TaxID=1544732 RepID=A0A927MGK2_9ACTN|nr:hypothetical protein [Plantactinospora soyae]